MPVVHDRNAVSRMICCVGPTTRVPGWAASGTHSPIYYWASPLPWSRFPWTSRLRACVAGAIAPNRALQENAESSSCGSRQQLVGLHRPPRWPVAAGAAGGSFRGSLPPPVPFLGPRAWLLDRDRLGPKGTMIGPRVCTQFGLLIPISISPGPLGARGPAGDVLEPAVGFFSPGQLSYWASPSILYNLAVWLVENLEGPLGPSARSTLLVKAVEDCFLGRHFIFGIKVSRTEREPWLEDPDGNESSRRERAQFVASQMILPTASGLTGCTVHSYYQRLLQKASEHVAESSDPSKTFRPLASPLLLISGPSPNSTFSDVTLFPFGLLSQSILRSQHHDHSFAPTSVWQQSLGLVTSSAEQEEICSQDGGNQSYSLAKHSTTPHPVQRVYPENHPGTEERTIPLQLEGSQRSLRQYFPVETEDHLDINTKHNETAAITSHNNAQTDQGSSIARGGSIDESDRERDSKEEKPFDIKQYRTRVWVTQNTGVMEGSKRNEGETIISTTPVCSPLSEPEYDRASKPPTVSVCIPCTLPASMATDKSAHLSSPNHQAFQCSLCDRSFSQRGSLNRHVRSHLGVRPFPCPCCRMTFSRQYRVTEHMRVHQRCALGNGLQKTPESSVANNKERPPN
ncbi:hypothetical protein GOODEAATRI_014225 [Goodea atripinnis]|uniref:C2H2-type domain-containing protein n=1 Tax=Goodea atripinnis TaxID=208336 RepID=A0ABV0NXU9_9TELE